MTLPSDKRKGNRIAASKLLEPVLVAALCLVALGYCLERTKTAPFHIDEAHKIAETYYYDLLFVQHDFAPSHWGADFYARTNPPVAKYIMGAYLAARGCMVRDLSLQEAFERDWANPRLLSKQVPRSVLLHARAVSALFGVLTLLMIYISGRLSGSRAAGVVGATLLAGNPLFRYHASVALSDCILMFFMTAIVPVSVMVLRSWTGPQGDAAPTPGGSRSVARGLAWSALAAVTMAAAAGTKLNGALSAGVFMLIMSAGGLLGRPRLAGASRRAVTIRIAAATAAVLCLSAVLYWGSNPYLHDAPLSKSLGMLKVYGDWMLKQAIDPGPPLWTAVQKLSAWGLFAFSAPQSAFFRGEIPLLFPLFFVGLASITLRLWARGRIYGVEAGLVATLAWAMVYIPGVLAWVPLGWDRYFLPTAPSIALISGYGVVLLFGPLRRLRKRRAPAGDPAASKFHVLSAAVPAIIVSLVLWYGVMDRSLLPPQMVPAAAGKPEAVARRYGGPGMKYPGDPLRAIYAGDARLVLKDPSGASVFYLDAIEELGRRPQGKMERVMTAISRFSLAQAYDQMGRPSDAAKSLEEHIADLEGIVRTLTSGDQKVIGEFGRTIEERRALARQIRP
jgi:hypothetical protein